MGKKLYRLAAYIYLVFYLSVFFLLAAFFSKAMDQERERALNEYRFLSGLIAAEISGVENEESEASISPGTIISKYGDYYSDFGIYLQLSNQNEVFYESPYVQQTKNAHPFIGQTCQIINVGGTRFVRVVDSLTGTKEDYTFVLQRDITDVYRTEIKHASYLILAATGCITVLAVLLYLTMNAIYKPINNLAHELKTRWPRSADMPNTFRLRRPVRKHGIPLPRISSTRAGGWQISLRNC